MAPRIRSEVSFNVDMPFLSPRAKAAKNDAKPFWRKAYVNTGYHIQKGIAMAMGFVFAGTYAAKKSFHEFI